LLFDALKMAEVDVDGAVREAAEATAGDTRADFFRKAALSGGGLVAGGTMLAALPEVAGAQTSRDREILNFALTLEYLEAEFYTQAIRGAGLSGDLLRLTRLVSNHENIHVTTLRRALGRRAVAKPRFDFKDTVTNAGKFLDTAIVLEDTGVAAYAGQGPRLQTRSVVEVALSIHSVEARHAAAFRKIKGIPEAPRAFDRALTMRQVLRAVAATGFIQS
jgi:rubrerythrin